MLSTSGAAALSVRHLAVSHPFAAVTYFLTLREGLMSTRKQVTSDHESLIL